MRRPPPFNLFIKLSLFFLLPTLIACNPSSFASSPAPSPSTTIIDILSSFPEYSILLKHLQKHGLINLINQSRNSTFIAPVNGAFYKFGVKSDDEVSELVTKDVLLYHFLNGTVISTNVTTEVILQSHLSRRGNDNNGIPVVVSPNNSSEEDDIPLKVNGVSNVVEPDLMAGYHRGVVQGVDRLLNIPPSLCEVINSSSVQSFSFFSKIFSQEYCKEGKKKRDIPFKDNLITLLLPNNPAFDNFNKVEKQYLLSKQGHLDRKIIINRHIIPQILKAKEERSARTANVISVTTIDGTTLCFDNNYIINSTFKPDDVNILTSDGIIYTYDSLISTPYDDSSNIVKFTPEKYLQSLGAKLFVTETHLRNQQSLIDGTTTSPQSIFVYPMDSSETNNHPNIRYHFVDGNHALDKIKDKAGTYLLDSKLSSHRMGDYYQKIKATVTSSGKISLNSQYIVSSDYNVGNTSIYLLDGDLDVPPSLSYALGPFFQSSYSVGFLESTGLLSPPKNKPPRTYFVPSRRAWENQNLLKKYLQANETALKSVFESLIFETPIYTNEPRHTVHALDGTESTVSIVSVGDGGHTGPYVAFLNGTSYDIDAEDILFNSGVAHSIDQISVPQSIDISPRDLILSGGREEFIDLLESRNLSHILNHNESYTILVPNMENLAKNGYSSNSSNIDELLSLHILPGNPISSLFDGEPTDTLNDDVQLSGRNVTDNFHLITIVDGTGQETYVVSRGDAQNYDYGKHSTVLFLDRYISPDWINRPFTPPFRLKTYVAVLLGAALGLILAATSIVTCLYAFVGTRKSVESDDDERRSLLDEQPSSSSRTNSPSGRHSIRSTRSSRSAHSRDHSNQGGSTSPNNNNYYSTISSNSSTNPIATTHVNEHREFGRHLNLPSS